jgi:hypothetical protein
VNVKRKFSRQSGNFNRQFDEKDVATNLIPFYDLPATSVEQIIYLLPSHATTLLDWSPSGLAYKPRAGQELGFMKYDGHELQNSLRLCDDALAMTQGLLSPYQECSAGVELQ